jgi:molybdopterin/thiamine biosynthesis adenylyltransferase
VTPDALREHLRAASDGDLLPWSVQTDAAARFGLELSAVEDAALASGLLPSRYRRNRGTVSVADQLRLFRSRVAVVGCGGLGGYLVEQLARLGVGRIAVIDPDVFEEHNLNRQLLSSPAALGRPKVAVAAERVAAVNPAVRVEAHHLAFSAANGPNLLAGCAAVLDGLDSTLVRLELAATCRALAVPVVHGAIAGWYGHVAVQLPGAEAVPFLRGGNRGKGVETTLGNPSFTPAVVASLQVAEASKVLLGRGTLLAGRTLFVDLLGMRFHELPHG